MGAPGTIFTGSAGASGHNSAVATGKFTQAAGVEDPFWIHLGFVPKQFWFCNAGDGVIWLWTEGFGTAVKDMNTSTVDASENVEAIDGNGAASIVTATDVYLSEGLAVISAGADPQDRIIGVKITGTTINKANDTYYYAAIS